MKILVTALRIVKFALMGVRVCSCFLGYKWKVTCSESTHIIIGNGYRQYDLDTMQT